MSAEEEYGRLYGAAADRPAISKSSIEDRYTVIRNLQKASSNNIGSCNFGVYLVKSKLDDKNYVQKKISTKHKILLREIYFIRHLNHPNIIKFVDASITKSPEAATLYIEWANYGSLDTLIDVYNTGPVIGRSDRDISESFIWHIFRSLASALQYLHHGIPNGVPSPRLRFPGEDDEMVALKLLDEWQLILHRDIKPHNIFLRAARPITCISEEPRSFPLCFVRRKTESQIPTFPRVILADFGIATKRGEKDFDDIGRLFGTPEWMPPELPESTARGDIWSLGAVIYSLCWRFRDGPLPPPPPDFQGQRRDWLMSQEARKGLESSKINDKYSKHLDDMVYNCLRRKSSDRPFAFKLFEDIEVAKTHAAAEGKLTEESLPNWVIKGLKKKS